MSSCRNTRVQIKFYQFVFIYVIHCIFFCISLHLFPLKLELLLKMSCRNSDNMDFSHLIRGTREFFQGHPGKPKDNGIVPPFINFPEAKNGVKRNHETSYNLQSHSQVIKSNCPTQPNIHGTVSQYYHEPYSKNFTSNQQNQSSEQVDEFHAPNMEVKNHTWIQSAAVYSAHTPKIHYGEQKVWQQNIYSDGGDVSANTRLHHNPPIPATNSSMVTPTACQGHQQPVSVKNNECMVPAVNNLHRRLPEESDCCSYSTNVVGPAFVQDKSKNVHQYQRMVPSRDNLNLMNFRESGRQSTFGKIYNQSLHLASDWRNQAEHTSAPVSCDCLFNRPCPLHRHSKQQDVPTLERQSSEWGSNIQNISIGNKFTRQKYEHTSLELPNERPNALQNPEMMKHHQTFFQQNYQIQELPNTTSSNIAFAPFRANVEADVSPRLSTEFRPHRQTYLNELPGMKTENNLGSEVVGGVSVIQQPKYYAAVSSVEATKKNEERMSVINYPKQHHLSNSSATLPNVLFSKNAKDQSISADVLISWPKKELITHECKNLQSGASVVSNMQQNQVSMVVDCSNNSSLDRQRDRITKPPKSKTPCPENPVIHIPPTENCLIDSTPIKSDPIVSDEKWEEWKSSFDTEWNAFVQDLAVSDNIKRIHRVTQPMPRKIKRKEKAQPKPIKSGLDSKLPIVTDFSSDEDIPLSLRRKTKEDQCNKIL
ncbi:hypothetical protein GHT06_010411 [Daphnia sinensis]|uniref:Uncharacterized protein n=1 Tax=Daphnia sinensis TaxID=1820382 RepID=A0AAD5LJ30_9CRUS|nr:hypothetical protein GHT06_010411 [Daphnia sinensis]